MIPTAEHEELFPRLELVRRGNLPRIIIARGKSRGSNGNLEASRNIRSSITMVRRDAILITDGIGINARCFSAAIKFAMRRSNHRPPVNKKEKDATLNLALVVVEKYHGGNATR